MRGIKSTLWTLALVGSGLASAQSYQSLGSDASAAEIAAADTDLAPSGATPPGSGSALAGAKIYAAQCAHCHGAAGRGGLHEPLALDVEARNKDAQRLVFALDPARPRVVGNFWPYATTLYDYIRRAMPQLAPGTLSNDEAYAVTAYVLYLNGLLAEDGVVDGPALQALPMPARALYDLPAGARR